VAEVREADHESLEVIGVEEKPTQPKSSFAIMPLYVFVGSIFESLKKTQADRMGEIQLTDAIQGLLESGGTVQAINLRADDVRLDIGRPETYWEALEFSYRDAASKSVTV
jgi:dTDP-glucose pyrophosphorylase